MTGPSRPRPGPGPDGVPGAEPDPPLPGAWVAVGVVGLVVVAAVGAFLSVLLTPFRVGTALVPVGVVVAVVVNVVLARLGYAMTRSRGIAAVPVVVFFLAAWAPTVVTSGDVLLPGGDAWQTTISFATLLLGVFAGAVAAARAR